MENTAPKAIDNQHIDDMTNMPEGVVKTKINLILDFQTASQSNLAVGNDKEIAPELFNGGVPIISITTPAAHVNFIDSASLSDEQKQQLLSSNTVDFSQEKDLIQKGVHILPQTGLSSFITGLRSKSHGVDAVHIMGDISGLNVELDTPSILPTSTNPVNLDKHKAYPFTQKSGKTEFTFWGENNDAAYHNALEKEARQGILSKTINIDEHDLKDHVILFADETPPISYDPA